MRLTMAKLKQIIKEEMELASEGHGGFAGAARQKQRGQMHTDRRFRAGQVNSKLMSDYKATPPEGINQYHVDNVLNMFKELMKERKPRPDRNKIPETSEEMEVVKAWMGNDIGKIVAAAYVGEEDITSPKRQAELDSIFKNM